MPNRRSVVASIALITIIGTGLYIGNEISEAEAQGRSFIPPEYVLEAYLALGIYSPDEVRDGYSLLSAQFYFSESDPTKPAGVLLSHGANINARDADGGTALMSAAIWGNVTGLGFLLAHGADPNLEDDAGNTALFHLPYAPFPTEAAQLLIAAGADPCHRNHEGRTARDRYAISDGPLAAILPANCPARHQL